MSERWANLAKYGNPNGNTALIDAQASVWSAYSSTVDASFVFGSTAAASSMRPNKHAQCDFLRWCRGNESGKLTVHEFLRPRRSEVRKADVRAANDRSF